MSANHEARKQQLLRELAEARASLLEAARALPTAAQYRVFLGIWSPADLLAHLVGWDKANLTAVQELLRGELPGFYAHYDADWRTFNAGLVARYRRDDFAALLADVEQSHRELVALLAGIPAEEMVRDRGLRFRGWQITIERLMLLEVKDDREHAPQLRTATELGLL